MTKLTPMMQQWADCKAQAKDALLLFRLGDFYEAFFEDAIAMAQALDLHLTKRGEVPMSGIPWHTSESYIEKLIAKGFKVAIAEQIGEPQEGKLVERKIVRIISQGTKISSLPEKGNNYIASIVQLGPLCALSYIDLTTSEFKVIECENISDFVHELAKVNPAEIILTKKFKERFASFLEEYTLTFVEEYIFDPERAHQALLDHFKVAHLEGFGLKNKHSAVIATGALLLFLKNELNFSLTHIQTLSYYTNAHVLYIDPTSEKHLEIFDSSYDKENSLFYFIDQTQTPMGGRRLKEWLKKPLLVVEEIKKRQKGVEALYYKDHTRFSISSYLAEIRDLERLTMRVCSNFATPKDMKTLAFSLERILPIKEELKACQELIFKESLSHLKDVSPLLDRLNKALVDEPPLLGDGDVFRPHFNSYLDELKDKRKNGKNWLASYQNALKEELKIKTLKIGFNRVFGYYIEVSAGQTKNVPSHFVKKQTLAGCERYTTDALKEYENDLFNAEEKIEVLEKELFESLRLFVAEFASDIFEIAKAISVIDALTSLAKVAKENKWSLPEVNDSQDLMVEQGRHPMIAKKLPQGTFIPNNTHLHEKKRMMLITGPNMAGKSTYIRQVALLVILAQMGSFVPAARVKLGIVDKIFTRIGASDDLSRGQSTFMVEMSETANILNNATEKSLVILDEIGRGTSTYDGISIAMAVAEHLIEKKAKTLFATHYLELTHLAKRFSTVCNYHALIHEGNQGIVFLHQIGEGVAPRSYGIHVARLAGLPHSVLTRAQVILSRLEKVKEPKEEKKEEQLLLFP